MATIRRRARKNASVRKIGTRRSAPDPVGSPREIPQRELRNQISRVLAAVAAGARFRVTVGGRPVAELVPVSERRTFVPWAEVERIIREAPLDKHFLADVEAVAGQRIDEL